MPPARSASRFRALRCGPCWCCRHLFPLRLLSATRPLQLASSPDAPNLHRTLRCNAIDSLHRYKDSSCCTADFTQQLALSDVTEIRDGDDVFSWVKCGPLSETCEAYLIEVRACVRSTSFVASTFFSSKAAAAHACSRAFVRVHAHPVLSARVMHWRDVGTNVHRNTVSACVYASVRANVPGRAAAAVVAAVPVVLPQR
jgi:hypothetical protein